MAADETFQTAAPDTRMFAQYLPRAVSAQRRLLPQNLAITEASARDQEGMTRLLMDREGTTLESARGRVQRWLDADPGTSLLLCAHIDGAVVAYARAGFITRPADPEFVHVPEGWYLTGVVVDHAFRRQGVATALTRRRLIWIAGHANEAFYFANSTNLASIDLHHRLGFQEIQPNFRFPNTQFNGGVGILFRIALNT